MEITISSNQIGGFVAKCQLLNDLPIIRNWSFQFHHMRAVLQEDGFSFIYLSFGFSAAAFSFTGIDITNVDGRNELIKQHLYAFIEIGFERFNLFCQLLWY